MMPEIQAKAPQFSASLSGYSLVDKNITSVRDELRNTIEKLFFVPNWHVLAGSITTDQDRAFIHDNHLVLINSAKKEISIIDLATKTVKKVLNGHIAKPRGPKNIMYMSAKGLCCINLETAGTMTEQDRILDPHACYSLIADCDAKLAVGTMGKNCTTLRKGNGETLIHLIDKSLEDIVGLEAVPGAIYLWDKKNVLHLWTVSAHDWTTGTETASNARWIKRDDLDTGKIKGDIITCLMLKENHQLLVSTSTGDISIARTGGYSYWVTSLQSPARCMVQINNNVIAVGQDPLTEQDYSYIRLFGLDGSLKRELAFNKQKGSPIKLDFANGILRVIFSTGIVEACYLNEFATFADLCKQLTA